MTIVNTNIAALTAQSSMYKNTKEMESAMANLSSGLRINTAADDAAGLSISERLESQATGLSQAIRNAEDAQNMIDTIEGAQAEIVNSLQRLRELAVQSASGTNNGVDRAFLNKEASQLLTEINRISSNTSWNGMTVLDGTFDDKNIQTGAEVNQFIAIDVTDTSASNIGNFVIRGAASSAAEATAGADNAISASTTIIAGFAGTKTISTAANDTAREFAQDVNGVTEDTGVTAKAITRAILQTLSAAGSVTLEIGKQGAVGTSEATVSTVTATITDTTDLSALRDAINEVSGATGVVATSYEGDLSKILLTDDNGDDIQVQNFLNSGSGTLNYAAYSFHGDTIATGNTLETLASGGSDSGTIHGEVVLSSSKSFAITGSAQGEFFGGSGSTTAAFQSSLESVGSVDLGTQMGAQKALLTIDGAIDHINNQRSDLGAISNRLDKTINNLTNVVENTTESLSHIRDANFAAETSKLTKAQILNQAATSMLAQANASKQTVLALLQN